MTRPVTLFTGQWADLPLTTLAQKAAEMGYDGLELHVGVTILMLIRLLFPKNIVRKDGRFYRTYNLTAFAISNIW